MFGPRPRLPSPPSHVPTPPYPALSIVHDDTKSLFSQLAAVNKHRSCSITNVAVHTLGELALLPSDRALLSLTTRFIPTPRPPSSSVVHLAIARFSRSCRLADYFATSPEFPSHDFSPLRPTTWLRFPCKFWTPPRNTLAVDLALEAFTAIVRARADPRISGHAVVARSNVSAEQLASIARLSASDLVVAEADKGMGVCVCTREYARAALAEHLSDTRTYRILECNADKLLRDWRTRAHKALVEVLRVNPAAAEDALLNTTLPVFRTMPKVHKMGSGTTLDSRPITSACNSPTTIISNVLVSLLAPLTAKDGWTLDSSYSLMRILECNTTPIPSDAVFLCFDVVALYTNMPIHDTVAHVCLRFATFYKVPLSHVSVVSLRTLLTLLLCDNMFEVPGFGEGGASVVFTQQHGIPMGLSVCVIIANIFVGDIFGPVFHRAHKEGRIQVHLVKGYVDDGFAILTAKVDGAVQTLIADLNSAHPSITVTTACDPTHAVFLDMEISKGARWEASGHVLLDCKVHTKPNSLHLYIPYSSSHPRGAVTGFIAGEARRFVCLCTAIEDAREQCLAFAKALHARGYPLDVIVRQLCKIDYGSRMVYLKLAQAQPPSGSTSSVNATSTGAALIPAGITEPRTVAFVLPFTPASARWGIGEALRTCFEGVPHLKTVLAWRNASNLQRTLGLRGLKSTSSDLPLPPNLPHQ